MLADEITDFRRPVPPWKDERVRVFQSDDKGSSGKVGPESHADGDRIEIGSDTGLALRPHLAGQFREQAPRELDVNLYGGGSLDVRYRLPYVRVADHNRSMLRWVGRGPAKSCRIGTFPRA
jgi:hypothetical protein